MKKAYLLFISLITLNASAQTVNWASKVLGFSSERTEPINQGPQYRAMQVLGTPNKLPQTGESVCAWSPSGADTYAEEYIKVGFDKPVKTRQI